MAGFLNKVRDMLMIGRVEDDEDDEIYEQIEEEEEITPEPEVVRSPKRGFSTDSINSKIVNLHTNPQTEVVISYPESVDDASCICDFLKSNGTVVVNLENADREQSQRVVDFLSGVSYAIGGEIQAVSSRIFIVVPSSVKVSGRFKEDLKANGLIFPWVTSL